MTLALDDPRNAIDSAAARELIRMRERQMKGSLARLANPRALERWNGVPLDAEDARDVEKMLTNRDLEEALVSQLPAPTKEDST